MAAVLLSIFGDIERLLAGLYDYRYPITAVAVVVMAGAVVLAYRAGIHRLLWRHRLATGLIGAPLLVVSLVGGYYLASPLWQRTFLEEDSPLAAAMTVDRAEEAAPAPSGSFQPRVVLRGEVMGADSFHFGRGDALVIETSPGMYVLRFENFSVRNGPDLFVYLSPNATGFDATAVNLGVLKATDGAFNYELPPNLSLEQVKSAVVWCRQFAVLFATATLR